MHAKIQGKHRLVLHSYEKKTGAVQVGLTMIRHLEMDSGWFDEHVEKHCDL